MGEISDALSLIGEQGELDARQKSAEAARLKAAAHADAIEAARSEDGRLVLDRGDGRVIAIASMERGEKHIKLHIEWTIDGEPRPFNNPWFIVNPPVLVADENGDIVREIHDAETGEVVETHRYREDPLAALIEIIDDKCRRPDEGHG